MAAQQQGGGTGQKGREDRWADDPFARNTEEFRALLKRHREARRWSQERLASESEMDHSLVSRLESGQRSPTREAIGKLARGLDLPAEQKDRLLIAAGFFPEQPENALADEPAVTRIYRILRDEQTPQPVRDNIRALLNSLTEIALAS
jgi:transcriptional regulator with XRE-family HTH domain